MSAEEVQTWSGRAKPGMPLFPGPDDVRAAFIRSKGIDWTASYIDPAIWVKSTRTIVTRTFIAYERVRDQASGICSAIEVAVRPPSPEHHRAAA